MILNWEHGIHMYDNITTHQCQNKEGIYLLKSNKSSSSDLITSDIKILSKYLLGIESLSRQL